jgi:hypothetical protein
MRVKLLSSIIALALLAACGGGGGSGVATYSAMKVFSNGDGVGRGVANDGTKLVFIAPDLAAVITSANSATGQSVLDVQPSDIPVVQRLSSNANLRQGAVIVEGIATNVTIVEDDGGDASLILFDIPNLASLGMAGGSALTGNPTGSHAYNGTMSMGVRSSGGAGQQLGAFSMSAHFNTETYSFVGTTQSHSLTGTGLIDIPSGRFSSNSMNATTFGTSRGATMYGELHGNSANSVSGIFHTNESSATYSGGFVGTK